MVVTMKITFFWDATLCSLVDFQRSEEFTASIFRVENGAASSSKTSATIYQTIWYHIPEESNPHATYFTIIEYYSL
jgi:hypothetical protein